MAGLDRPTLGCPDINPEKRGENGRGQLAGKIHQRRLPCGLRRDAEAFETSVEVTTGHRGPCADTGKEPVVISDSGQGSAAAMPVDDQVERELVQRCGQSGGLASERQVDGLVVHALSDGVGAQPNDTARRLGEQQNEQPREPITTVDIVVVQ